MNNRGGTPFSVYQKSKMRTLRPPPKMLRPHVATSTSKITRFYRHCCNVATSTGDHLIPSSKFDAESAKSRFCLSGFDVRCSMFSAPWTLDTRLCPGLRAYPRLSTPICGNPRYQILLFTPPVLTLQPF
jgi:hypothetical protein